MEKKRPRTSLVRLLLIVLIGAILAVLIYFSPALFIPKEAPGPSVHLKTGGTSVVFLILENRWKLAYLKDKGVDLQYESTGSTKGLTEMADKRLAIAFTHTPMTTEQKEAARAKGGEVVHIPVVLCAVAPVYNVTELKGKKPLKFSGEVLAKIFLGKIDKWNNPELQGLQDKDVQLPPTPITVVHREDSSGTTFIFTDYLMGASKSWPEKFKKAGSEVEWPVGLGRLRSEGVAREVQATEGAIGYVDLVHALNYNLDYGAVQNNEGKDFVRAEAEKITAAAQAVAVVPEDLTFKLTNQPGENSYPISGVVWAVCYQTQQAADQKKVVDFLRWATHEGQQYAKNMAYAPLPDAFVQRVDKKLETIRAAQ